MLDSLEIQNYRNFKHLRIEKLGRVNLIIGKNNTGKTSLLEAVSILVKQNDLDWLYTILENRREHFEDEDMPSQQRIKNIAHLFYKRQPAFTRENAIIINATTSQLLKSFVLYLSAYKEVENMVDAPQDIIDSFGSMFTKREDIEPNESGKFGIKFIIDGKSSFKTFSRETILDMLEDLKGNTNTNNIIKFVTTNNQDEPYLFELWQDTQLTESESEVIDALQIFNSQTEKIERIGFATKDKNNYSIVKLKSIANPVPLRSMGDGINRILTIILSMVNCKDGYLLIDEFDNGLHVSVQKQLWEIVFYLANKLNIQVFATTHSNDTIKAFQMIANSQTTYNDAMLVKLVNRNGDVSAISADANELQEAIETLLMDLR
jgi:AAA15 family ATPase/GTPase